MKTIKERAVAIAARCKSESYSSMVGTDALQLVREIANAPEPEPVAHAILLPNGATRIWFSDRDSGELWRARERVEQELTPLYTAPPAKNQSEQHLKMVNPPAPSEHTKELIRELDAIRGSAKLCPSGAQGQTIGQETWRITLSGNSLQSLTDAADKLKLSDVKGALAAPQPPRLSDERILEIWAANSGRPVVMGKDRIIAQARAIEREILGGTEK